MQIESVGCRLVPKYASADAASRIGPVSDNAVSQDLSHSCLSASSRLPRLSNQGRRHTTWSHAKIRYLCLQSGTAQTHTTGSGHGSSRLVYLTLYFHAISPPHDRPLRPHTLDVRNEHRLVQWVARPNMRGTGVPVRLLPSPERSSSRNVARDPDWANSHIMGWSAANF